MRCTYLVPINDSVVIKCGEKRQECALKSGHEGPHLTQTQAHGWIFWEPEDCGECGDECECFVWWPAGPGEVSECSRE